MFAAVVACGARQTGGADACVAPSSDCMEIAEGCSLQCGALVMMRNDQASLLSVPPRVKNMEHCILSAS